MEVDLSTLEEGQTVKFRCGGEAVVETVDKTISISDGIYHLHFEGYGFDGFYKNGEHEISTEPSPFDIIEIIPKPFDWKDVKPGMAFLDNNKKPVWYVGPAWGVEKLVVICETREQYSSDDIKFNEKYYMVRIPEHDIKVPL